MSISTTRLGLELLDLRNAPSSLTGGNAVASTDWLAASQPLGLLPALSAAATGSNQSQLTVPPSPPSPPPPFPPCPGGDTNTKPDIQNFKVTWLVGWVGHYTGEVVDEHEEGLKVVLDGAQDCIMNSVTVTTNEWGEFHFEAQFNPVNGHDNGFAYANVKDNKGVAADEERYLVYLG